jgi:hypothetical protein
MAEQGYGKQLPGDWIQSEQVRVGREALDRLTELGLTVDVIERVLRRADAEANTCSPLDPPLVQGLIRWGRATRFLREELVVLGWEFDNPRNLARTIHPGGTFAIVVAHGDESTGRPALVPTAKHAKGDATAHAVQVNEQLSLDFEGPDPGFRPAAGQVVADDVLTWFLLFYLNDDECRVELSLPDAIVDGQFTSWAERIILPTFPLAAERVDVGLRSAPGPRGGSTSRPGPELYDPEDDVVVQVDRR